MGVVAEWVKLQATLWIPTIPLIFFFKSPFSSNLVSYLTQVSDLDLAPDPDQFVASPPVRYINSGCCVNFFQKSAMANNVFCIIFMVDPLVKGGASN